MLILLAWHVVFISIRLIDPPGVKHADFHRIRRAVEGTAGTHHAVIVEFELPIFVFDVVNWAVLDAFKAFDALFLVDAEHLTVNRIEQELDFDNGNGHWSKERFFQFEILALEHVFLNIKRNDPFHRIVHLIGPFFRMTEDHVVAHDVMEFGLKEEVLFQNPL